MNLLKSNRVKLIIGVVSISAAAIIIIVVIIIVRNRGKKETGAVRGNQGRRNQRKVTLHRRTENQRNGESDATQGTPQPEEGALEPNQNENVEHPIREENLEVDASLDVSPIVAQLWSIADPRARLDDLSTLITGTNENSYKQHILKIYEAFLKNDNEVLCTKVKCFFSRIKYETPTKIAKAVQDLTRFVEHNSASDILPVHKALFDCWKAVAALMQYFNQQRNLDLDDEYKRIFELIPSVSFSLYKLLIEFEDPTMIKAIFGKNFAWVRQVPITDEKSRRRFNYAHSFMQIFSKMKGQGMKGFLSGRGEYRLFVAVHPRVMGRLLQNMPNSRQLGNDGMTYTSDGNTDVNSFVYTIAKHYHHDLDKYPVGNRSFLDYLKVQEQKDSELFEILDAVAVVELVKNVIVEQEISINPHEPCDKARLLDAYRTLKTDPDADTEAFMALSEAYIAERQEFLVKLWDVLYGPALVGDEEIPEEVDIKTEMMQRLSRIATSLNDAAVSDAYNALEADPDQNLGLILPLLSSIEDPLILDQATYALKEIHEPTSYKHNAIIVVSSILNDASFYASFYITKSILKLLVLIRFNSVLLTQAVQDFDAISDNLDSKIDISDESKAEIKFWKAFLRFMLKYCVSRSETSGTEYNRNEPNDPEYRIVCRKADVYEVDDLYDSLSDFNFPDELKSILESKVEWQKTKYRDDWDPSLGVTDPRVFAKDYMIAFEIMNGEGLKGLLLGEAEDKCYSSIHPDLFKALLSHRKIGEFTSNYNPRLVAIKITEQKYPNAKKCLYSNSDFPSYVRKYVVTRENLFEALDAYAWFHKLMVNFGYKDIEVSGTADREKLLNLLPAFQADMQSEESSKEFLAQALYYMQEQVQKITEFTIS